MDNDDLSCSARDYARALEEIKVTPWDRRMLEAHYHAPNRVLTAKLMGKAMGWQYQGANVHYGD